MRNGVERRESAKGRKVKFVRLLGAHLNTGIINVGELRASAKHFLSFKDHLWVLQRNGTVCRSDSINEKLNWKKREDTGEEE